MELGLDRLPRASALLDRLRGARVGVLAHAASVDRALRPILAVLASEGVRPVVLFGPEHGFSAAAQDMASVGHARHPSGARIVSLYGDSPEALVPSREDLADIDVLVCDLVDVGSRYYTFVWTVLLAARAAAEVGVHCVLLDRPNPIDGETIEGRTQLPGFLSFVGLEPVPVRHGLTLAEMVLLHTSAADGLGPEGVVSALPVLGWERSALGSSWDRPFVLPSPNMPTADTALVYPGGCLLEGTNLSEGRGHTRPFEVCGAPFLDADRLASDLMALGLGGFVARPLSFVPMFHKHAGQPCHGVQVHPTDRSFRPVAVYSALIALAHAQAPDRFAFRTERYEFIDNIPAFDLLTGSAEAREMILAGASARDVAEHVSQPDPSWRDRQHLAAERLRAASWR